MSELSKRSQTQPGSDVEEAFAQVVATVKDYAIFALDPTGHVLTWNEGARRIKQYTKEEIAGKHFSTFYTEEDRQRKHPEAELELALKNGSYEEEGWRVRKDGSKFWAAVTITPMSGGRGFIKVTRDLTERRKYETDLAEARDQAMAASRAKSQFVANVTHELRTPLTSLVGLSELLVADTTTDDELHRTAVTMFEASKQLLSMLNSLLDFSRLESKKIHIEKTPYSLEKTIKDAIELVRVKCDAKHLSISHSVSNNVPQVIVGDSSKIRQILINLLDNAIKFTEAGAVEVTAEREGDHILVAVTDTGIGISVEQQEQLFKPFSQVHKDNTKYGGTGLGLSIAEQTIRLMGGDIGVTSKEGLGSTFWLAIPMSPRESSHD